MAGGFPWLWGRRAWAGEARAGLRVGWSELLCVRYFTLRKPSWGFCFRIQEASPREWPSEVSPRRLFSLTIKRNIPKDPIRDV